MATLAYIRYSTDAQDEQSQLNIIENYLRAKGMKIDKTYTDKGVSGGVCYRERNLFDLCKEAQVGDIIVVSEVSRLTRSGIKEISEIVSNYFEKNHLRLIICNVGLDIDCSDINPMVELQIAMLATFAKIERQLITDRTKAALAAKKKRDGSWANEYGKNTGTTREQALEKAREVQAEKKRAEAKADPNNEKFHLFICDYQIEKGKIDRYTDVQRIVDRLNNLGYKTSTGMDFNVPRFRSMLSRIRTIYSE